MACATPRNTQKDIAKSSIIILPETLFHRNSLSEPRNIISSDMADVFSTEPVKPPRNTNGHSEPETEEDFDDWMAPFCVEPHGDGNACGLAVFAPYAAYGQTHWRLDQISRGLDPSNDAWKPKFGFNSACGIYIALFIIFPPLTS
jgi:hypothetical protein